MTIKVTYNVTDVYVTQDVSPVYINVSYSTGSSGGAAVWGSITGTLSNQTDLQNALNSKFDDPTGTTSQYLRGDGSLATFPAIPSGTVTSVGLTMPSAFSVANSPITSSGTLSVTGAGTSAQYIRGDGQLANFPSGLGGGSAYNYYLNGSVNQGTFGGDVYYEMSKTPVLGAGTNFTRTNGQGNGYIASFITDAGDPSLLNIPAGNWNLEFYFQSSSTGGSPQFYAELYKVNSSNVFTLIASGSTNPEGITNGTTVDQYFTSIPVPQTSLLVTDRLAVRIYVIPGGRTITLHTENSNLCEILTTFSTGLNALNGLTAQVQYFATGTSGTDFGISSATDTHTFNLPTASSVNRGALSSADWTTFNNKVPASRTLTINGVAFDLSADRSWTVSGGISGSGASGQVAYWTGTSAQTGSNNLFWDNANGRLGIGTATPTYTFHVSGANAGIFLTRTSPDEGFILLTNETISSGGQIRGLSSSVGMRFTNHLGNTEWARFFATGNLGINTGVTDGGQRLQVQGTTLLNGNVIFSSSTGMFWDATNSRLGIGTSTPGANKFLDVNYNLSTVSGGGVRVRNTSSSGYTELHFDNNTTPAADGAFTIGYAGTTTSTPNLAYFNQSRNAAITFSTNATERLRIFGGGNIALGSTTDSGERLQVTGTMKVTGRTDIGTISGGSPGTLNTTGNIVLYSTNARIGTSDGSSGLVFGNDGINFLYFGGAPNTTLYQFSFGNSPGGGVYIRDVNSGTYNTTAKLQIDSTTKGFLPPRMTTTQKNAISSPAAGLVVYDTTLNKLCVFTTAWETITSV